MHAPRPLDTFPAGSRVRIAELGDCPRSRSRLCALGLTPGTEIEIVSCGSGPRCIEARGGKLVIGAGLCGKVLATPVNGDGTAASRELPESERTGSTHCKCPHHP